MDAEVDDEICEFDPTKHGLQDSFRLTDYANLKGWGCKVPQKILLKLLEGLKQNEEACTPSSEPRIGIGRILNNNRISLSLNNLPQLELDAPANPAHQLMIKGKTAEAYI